MWTCRRIFQENLLLTINSISVNRAAKLSSLKEAFAADFVCAVEWYIELEEASVRLRKAVLIHVAHKTHFVSSHICGVDWQPIATPNKLQVQWAFLRAKRLESPPETPNDFMILVTVRVRGDGFKALDLDCFLTTSPNFNGNWCQVRDQIKTAHKYGVKTILDRLKLFSGFWGACLEHQGNKLINVCLLDLSF